MRTLLAACFLITVSQISVSAEPVKSNTIDEAALTACMIDWLRQKSPSGLEKHLDPERTKQEETTWIARFNTFAASDDARILRTYAATLARTKVTRHRDQECERIVPAFGLAWTATTIDYATTPVQPGHLLTRCGKKLCIPAELNEIPQKCEISVSSARYLERCSQFVDPTTFVNEMKKNIE